VVQRKLERSEKLRGEMLTLTVGKNGLTHIRMSANDIQFCTHNIRQVSFNKTYSSGEPKLIS